MTAHEAQRADAERALREAIDKLRVTYNIYMSKGVMDLAIYEDAVVAVIEAADQLEFFE